MRAAAVRRKLRGEYRRARRMWQTRTDHRYLAEHLTPGGPATVMVHFADDRPERSLYQLRQWYEPLAELNRAMPVVISVREATTGRAITQECDLPVEYLRRPKHIEAYMLSADPRVVFYVNHLVHNFQVMRYARAMHVFISHGESEKVYMASGQVRAYDFTFIAGQAAHDRLLAAVPNYDPAVRTRQIGRPQLDFLPPDQSGQGPRRTVLYAPTYEGDRPSMAYGSVLSHGRALVAGLIAAGYRVIYRPHPLTGSLSPAYLRADHEVREMITAANASLPAGDVPHVIDTAARIAEQIAQSDVAVVDNSAMAFDWLVTGKPLIVTIPARATGGVQNNFLSACYRLAAPEAGRAADLVAQALRYDSLAAQRGFWIRRHFGDTSPGASTRRFIEATAEIVQFGAGQVRLTEQHADELAATLRAPGTATGDS
jgi:hypothetical protein